MKSVIPTVKWTDDDELLRPLSEEFPVGACIMQDGKFYYVNSTFPIAIGYTVDELLGKDSLEIVVPEDRDMVKENTMKMLKGKLRSPYQFRVTCKNGSIVWVMATVKSVQYHGKRATLGNYMEITERKRMEEKVRHFNLVLRAIRNINQLIAKGTDRDGLLKGACDTFVKTRGYYSAWIALLDEPGKLVTAAQAGLGKSFSQVMERLKRGELTPCGCKVLEKPGVLVMKDISSECEDCPVAKEDTGRGAMSVRLEYGGKVYGLMTVSMPPGRVAEKEEHDLLEEIAGDIAFALYSMEQEQEHKQAENALHAERNKLQSLVDAMEDTVTIQDTEYNIIYQNEPSRIASGGDHVGEKCYRVYEGRDTVCEGCPVETAFKDGKSHTAERMTTIGGTVTFWENTANPIRDAEGKIVSCLELTRDITERKKQEQALADEVTRRRILVDKSLDGIVVLDVDAKVVEANQRFAEMLGYTLEEVYKLHTWEWDKNFPPEKILEMGRNVDEKGLHLDTKHTRKDGSVIDVDISISEIMYGGQKLIFCIQRDVTERNRAKEALQAERNKLQSLVDAMEDGLTIQDRDYNIIYEGRLQSTLFGDHLGEKCYRVYEGREKVCEGCPVEKAFKDGKSHTAERTSVLPSGEVTFWENTANPIRDARGEIVSCLEVSRNITERKKQEQALADELTQRRLLIDKSLDGIVVLDVDAKVVEANHRFAEMLGYTLEEVYELHTWDWDKNYTHEQILEMGQNVDEQGIHLETKHTRKDGSVIDVDISISGIMYGGRKLIFCIQRDITERKRADEALRNSEESYRELADSITDVFFAMDKHLRYIYWNKASEILTGIRAEDALGKSLPEVFPDSPGLRRAEKVYRAVLKTQKSRTFVNDYDIDGRHYIFEINAYPSRGGISVFVRDITERKQAEEALKAAEEEKSSFLEEAPVGIIHTDLKGEITYVNKRFESESGYSREEIIGKSGLQLDWFPDGTMKYLSKRMAARLRGSPAKHWETQFKCKDGRWIWIELEGKVLRRSGVPVGFQIIAANITERKQAEEALRRSEERYRTMLEEMEEGYYEADIVGNFTFVNDAMSRILGYSRDELIGMNYKIYTPKEDVKPILQAYNRVYRTSEPLKWFPMPEIRKDGTRILAEDSVFPFRNEKGEVIGFRGISRDITDRKRAEEALRQSEERYRTILEETGDGYFETDLAGNFTFVNDAQACLLGCSKKEMIGVNHRAFTPEEKAESVFKAYKRMYKTGEPLINLSDEVIRKDGSHGFAETSAFPIRNDRGEIVGFRGVRRDITARKQMEEALRHSEEKYRTILEEMEDAYFEVDLGGHLTFVNNPVCRDLGYSKEELMGKSYKVFTVEDDIESLFRVFNEVYRTGVSNKGFPWMTVRKDGSHGFAETSISLLRNEQGETIGFRGVGRDITERKRAEEKLRQSEENYRALFDNSVIGTIVLDAETMKIVMANQAAAKIFGFSSVEEGIGLSPIDLIVPEDKETVIDVITKELLEQDLRITHEFRAITKDGREIWISATGARIKHEGRLAGLISFTDITEQKRQNERLMMTDRLASIGELAAGTAHELNNPLTSIIGFSQLLMERESPDDIREDLKLINSEAQRAASVTRNLLTFARKHAPVKELNQINNIIEDVLKLRAREHKVNCIEVRKHLAPDVPRINIDYYQMQQVFLNIIMNAEYSMIEAHKKGTLTIGTKKQNGSTVRISIADDGPGIPQENLGRIFDPFFTTKAAGKGTGLGLSICHGIVAEHGGQIYARSQPGEGAIILIELPINGSNRLGVAL